MAKNIVRLSGRRAWIKTSKPARPEPEQPPDLESLFDPRWFPLWKKRPKPKPKPRRPTPRQQVILAIIRRRYRNGIPAGTKIAPLHRLVGREWEAECTRQKLTDPKIVKAVP